MCCVCVRVRVGEDDSPSPTPYRLVAAANRFWCGGREGVGGVCTVQLEERESEQRRLSTDAWRLLEARTTSSKEFNYFYLISRHD